MLPKIDQPIYTVKLLSRDKPLRFRPFTVKEYKILLMAKESNEVESIIDSLRQIANNCLLDEVDVTTLPLVDLELLLLNLRARSMGEIAHLVYKCTNSIANNTCGMLIEIGVNLLEVPIANKEAQGRIMLSDDVGVQMRLPTFEMLKTLQLSNEPDKEVELAAHCIDYVFDKQSVYKASETTFEERLNFVEQLPSDKYDLLEEFFNRLPTIKQNVKQVCPKCDFKHEFILEGLEDFFL